MQKIDRLFLAMGAFTLLLATVLGAYGTHALRASLGESAWTAFETAVDYQFYHGLGIIVVALVTHRYPRSRWVVASGWLLIVGVVLFCGSIYGATFGAPAIVVGVAPVGGVSLMLGWLALGVGALNEWRAGEV